MSNCVDSVLSTINTTSFDTRLAKAIAARHKIVFREDDPHEIARIERQVLTLCKQKLNEKVAEVLCAPNGIAAHNLQRTINGDTVLKKTDDFQSFVAGFVQKFNPDWRNRRLRHRAIGVIYIIFYHIGKDIYRYRYA